MNNDDTPLAFMTCFLLSFSFLLSNLLVKIERLQCVLKKKSYLIGLDLICPLSFAFFYSFERRIPFIQSILLVVYIFIEFCLFFFFFFLTFCGR